MANKDTDLLRDLFIFEVANNHEGSVDHGNKIIDAMAKITKRHGVKAGVKFQYRNLETFVHPDYKDREDVKHIPRFFQNRLSGAEFLNMVRRVKEQGMLAIVTPFDEASVQQCIEHEVDIIKVASCSATDWPLLGAVAEAMRLVIVSTGGLSIYEIDDVVSFLTHKQVNFALMHCVAVYPTPNELLQFNFMAKMIRRYPQIPVGYSGHEDPDNLDAIKVAVSKGAQLLERHVGVPAGKITLNAYSMNPQQTERWVAAALLARQLSGEGDDKTVTAQETESLLSLKRGVFAAKPIKKGEAITRDKVFFAMPALAVGHLTSGKFGKYRATYRASRDYAVNQAVYEKSHADSISAVRGVVHDVKGMLHEAGVHLGREAHIELSHHYGLDQFRQTGALIINVINREYCKKLLALLPGQQHPKHYHKLKEETFQLLWGDLQIDLEGKIVSLNPGETLLVGRGVWHSFTTQRGAVIEEISTTHRKGDSYYEDESISVLDPMERKTTLESW